MLICTIFSIIIRSASHKAPLTMAFLAVHFDETDDIALVQVNCIRFGLLRRIIIK